MNRTNKTILPEAALRENYEGGIDLDNFIIVRSEIMEIALQMVKKRSRALRWRCVDRGGLRCPHCARCLSPEEMSNYHNMQLTSSPMICSECHLVIHRLGRIYTAEEDDALLNDARMELFKHTKQIKEQIAGNQKEMGEEDKVNKVTASVEQMTIKDESEESRDHKHCTLFLSACYTIYPSDFEFRDHARVKATDMRERYLKWCDETTVCSPIGRTSFYRVLDEILGPRLRHSTHKYVGLKPK